jgi:plastocyanin
MQSFKVFTPLLWAAILAFGAFSCSGTQSSVTGSNGISGNCSTNEAQIAVYDTFLQNLCGCQEPATEAIPPANLTCTVSSGTTVLFWFFNNDNLRHQIISTSQPTFQPSSLFDPSSGSPIITHVVTLTDPGTYNYQDVFNSGMNGTFIVQ